MKDILKRTAAFTAALMLTAANTAMPFAAEMFKDYDKYQSEKYNIRLTRLDSSKNITWSNKDADDDNDLMTQDYRYDVFDLEHTESIDVFTPIIQQNFQLKYTLPKEYTDYFSHGRQGINYESYKGNTGDEPRITEKNSDMDADRYYQTYTFKHYCAPEWLKVYDYSDLYFSVRNINVKKEESKSFEDAVNEQEQTFKEDCAKEDGYHINEYERKNISADRIILIEKSVSHASDDGKTSKSGPHNEPVDTVLTQEVNEITFYYLFYRIPEIPELYFELMWSTDYTTRYEQNTKHPYAPLAEKHDEMLERYEHCKNVIVPALENSTPEIIFEDAIYNFKDKGKEKDDIVIDTDADEETGENKGVSIPDIIVFGAAGAAAAAAAGAAAGSGPDNDGDKRRSSFKMYLNKEFGDTIAAGHTYTVYARMVEVKPSGEEVDRPDLTAKIKITSPDEEALMVRQDGMRGDYMSALVWSSYDTPRAETGVVSFSFTGEGGKFTNNVRFKIMAAKIVFGQDNLSLPACYDKTTRLSFLVAGAGDNTVVTAKIRYSGSSVSGNMTDDPEAMKSPGYTVNIEKDADPAKTGLYHAVIDEVFKGKQPAGSIDHYVLEVKAVTDKDELEEPFDIYRIHLGLAIDINALDCYNTLKKGSEFNKELYPEDYEPKRNPSIIRIICWDEESETITNVVPVPSEFKVTALKDAKDDVKKRINDLCIAIDYSGARVHENGLSVDICCTKAVFDPPIRHKAMLTMKSEWNGHVYTCEKEVLLRSQPPLDLTAEQRAEQNKLDSERTEILRSHKRNMETKGYTERYAPLYALINTMLNNYSPTYGYDKNQFEKVDNAYRRILGFEIAYEEATRETFSLAGEMWKFCEAVWNKGEEVENSLGFFERLALGVVTLGASETAFLVLKIPRDMKAYVDNGGDSVFAAFAMGAWTVTFEYLTDKAMGKLTEKAKDAYKKFKTKRAAKVKGVDINAPGSKCSGKTIEQVKECTSTELAKNSSDAAKAVKEAADAAKKQADELAAATKKRLASDPTIQQRRQAMAEARKLGKDRVNDLKKALKECDLTPDQLVEMAKQNKPMPDSVVKAIHAIQKDKSAMHVLERTGGTDAKKVFNNYWQEGYKRIDKRCKARLSAELDAHPKRLSNVNATASDAKKLAAGETITRDRDITWQRMKNGKAVDVDINTQKSIYSEEFYREFHGDPAKVDSKKLLNTLDDYDQAIVASGSAEKYGSGISDLKKLTQKQFQGQKLSDGYKVGMTVEYKGLEWHNKGLDLREQATRLKNEAMKLQASGADPSVISEKLLKANQLMAESENMVEESIRQLKKQYNNIVSCCDIAVMQSTGTKSAISDKMRVAFALAEKVGKGVSPAEYEAAIKTLGFDIRSLANALGNTLAKIDMKLK